MEVVVSSMSSGVKDVVETGVSGWVRSDPKTKNQGGTRAAANILGQSRCRQQRGINIIRLPNGVTIKAIAR